MGKGSKSRKMQEAIESLRKHSGGGGRKKKTTVVVTETTSNSKSTEVPMDSSESSRAWFQSGPWSLGDGGRDEDEDDVVSKHGDDGGSTTKSVTSSDDEEPLFTYEKFQVKRNALSKLIKKVSWSERTRDKEDTRSVLP